MQAGVLLERFCRSSIAFRRCRFCSVILVLIKNGCPRRGSHRTPAAPTSDHPTPAGTRHPRPPSKPVLPSRPAPRHPARAIRRTHLRQRPLDDMSQPRPEHQVVSHRSSFASARSAHFVQNHARISSSWSAGFEQSRRCDMTAGNHKPVEWPASSWAVIVTAAPATSPHSPDSRDTPTAPPGDESGAQQDPSVAPRLVWRRQDPLPCVLDHASVGRRRTQQRGHRRTQLTRQAGQRIRHIVVGHCSRQLPSRGREHRLLGRNLPQVL
jgi:hypothetical protein